MRMLHLFRFFFTYIYSLYIHTYTYTRISNVREKQGEIKFDRARERMIANIENFK